MSNERSETIKKIRELSIPRGDLAAICELPASRIAEFIHGRPLAASKVEKIIRAVDDVAFVWSALSPYRLDTSDAEVFRRAVTELRAAAHILGGSPKATVAEEVRA